MINERSSPWRNKSHHFCLQNKNTRVSFLAAGIRSKGKKRKKKDFVQCRSFRSLARALAQRSWTGARIAPLVESIGHTGELIGRLSSEREGDYKSSRSQRERGLMCVFTGEKWTTYRDLKSRASSLRSASLANWTQPTKVNWTGATILARVYVTFALSSQLSSASPLQTELNWTDSSWVEMRRDEMRWDEKRHRLHSIGLQTGESERRVWPIITFCLKETLTKIDGSPAEVCTTLTRTRTRRDDKRREEKVEQRERNASTLLACVEIYIKGTAR